MKNYQTFVTDVAEMRRLQKEYFRTRSTFILEKCKNAERKVDAYIIEHLKEICSQGSQMRMEMEEIIANVRKYRLNLSM